jgi:hypothetical protein
MTRVIDRLLRRAHLFDDPGAYEAGVRDAVEALAHADETPSGARDTTAPVSRTA